MHAGNDRNREVPSVTIHRSFCIAAAAWAALGACAVAAAATPTGHRVERSRYPVARHGVGLGPVLPSKFGGEIFGWDLDQNGNDGLLTESVFEPNGRDPQRHRDVRRTESGRHEGRPQDDHARQRPGTRGGGHRRKRRRPRRRRTGLRAQRPDMCATTSTRPWTPSREQDHGQMGGCRARSDSGRTSSHQQPGVAEPGRAGLQDQHPRPPRAAHLHL